MSIAGEDAKQLELSYDAGENTKWYSHFVCWLLIKLNIHLPWDPTIPSLGISSGEMKTCVYTKICVQKFIAALFIMYKNCKQLCPSTDEWINKL